MQQATEFTEFATLLAQESSRVIMPWFGNHELIVEQKSDESPVTIADRAAEQIMRDLIHKNYPGHGVIGEEFGSERADAEHVWVLDPIDGTASFTTGCPLFGTLIALMRDGRPVLGAIHLPALKQLCMGDSSTTELNGKTVKMRPEFKLAQATVLASGIDTIKEFQSWQRFEKLLGRTRMFRTWGDCYGYVLLATGWADIMLDPIMHAWDLMALVPIIEGAGGIITDWHGEDAVEGTSCIAANKSLHSKVVRMLNRHQK
ncbi:histidinol-phosphatase [candidate division KSB1 bacterium]|nr:histidinol-phosphatase [candidate division KSB1 bacterium]